MQRLVLSTFCEYERNQKSYFSVRKNSRVVSPLIPMYVCPCAMQHCALLWHFRTKRENFGGLGTNMFPRRASEDVKCGFFIKLACAEKATKPLSHT